MVVVNSGNDCGGNAVSSKSDLLVVKVISSGCGIVIVVVPQCYTFTLQNIRCYGIRYVYQSKLCFPGPLSLSLE